LCIRAHSETSDFVDRNDLLFEVVARKVVEVDATGTRDPEEIAKRAVRELGVPPYGFARRRFSAF